MEPRLRAQLNKVKVKANAEFEKLFPKIQPCRVEIETTDGKIFDRRIDVPKGDPRDPMTPGRVDGQVRRSRGAVLQRGAAGEDPSGGLLAGEVREGR